MPFVCVVMRIVLEFADLGLMMKLLLYVFLIGNVFAAEDAGQRGAALEVLHFPWIGRTSYAFFRKDQTVDLTTHKPLSSVKSNNLFSGLREQILAGYRLVSDIEVEDVMTHRNFFLAAVCEHIGQRQPFLSSELEWWFARIGELLDVGASLSLSLPGRWQKMDKDFIKTRIYPARKTRKWSVIALNRVHRSTWHDRVCITFRGTQVALEGVLCWRPDSIVPDARSLLECKRLFEQKNAWIYAGLGKAKPQKERRWVLKEVHKKGKSYRGRRVQPLKPIPEDNDAVQEVHPVDQIRLCAKENMSFVDALFTHILPNDFDVDDMYVFLVHHNQHLSLATNGSVMETNVFLRSQGTYFHRVMTIRDAVGSALLRGFALKRPEHGCEDVRLLMVPQVRKVVCKKQRFIHTGLQEKILEIIQDLDTLNSSYLEYQWTTLIKKYGELYLSPHNQKILWSIEEDDEFLNDVLVHKKPSSADSGTVFCLMRGESVFLKGVPVPETYKDNAVETNLQFYWYEQVCIPLHVRPRERKNQEDLVCTDIR